MTTDPKDALATRLLAQDFSGLYEAHLKALEDYNYRFRTVLAVLGVPLLAIGALLSAGAPGALDIFGLPEAMYLLFLIIPVLGWVVIEMWVRSALAANLFARALNRCRGFYVGLLRSQAALPTLDPWLPLTPRQPDWRSGDGAKHLSQLVAVLSLINFVYGLLGLTGLFRVHDVLGSRSTISLVLGGAGFLAWHRYYAIEARLVADQTAVERRLAAGGKSETKPAAS